MILRETAQGIVFKILVQPRSSRNMLAGFQGDALKVKITAPPADGQANKICIKFLAKHLKLPKSSLEIVSGHTSRTKQILARWPQSTSAGEIRADLRKRLDSLFLTE